MAQILPRNDIFGRIGQGVGKGAGDAYTEIAKKQQLSKGLESIRNAQKESGYNPLDTYARLASTPYLDPAHIGPLSDLLRQENLKNKAGKPMSTRPPLADQRPQTVNERTNATSPNRAQGPTENVPQEAFRTESPKTSLSKYERPEPATLKDFGPIKPVPDPRQVDLDRINYIAEGYSPEQAAAQAQADAAYPGQVWEAQNAAQNQALIDLKNEVSNRLQVPQEQGAFDARIPNEYYKKVENEYLSNLRKGVGVDKAKEEAVSKLHAFDKARLRNEGLTSDRRWSPFDWANSLDSVRTDYEKAGALELYKQDLQSLHGFSPDLASTLAFPNSKRTNELVKGFRNFDPATKAHGKEVKQFVDLYMKQLKDADSLQSLRYALRERGIDPEPIMLEIADRDAQDPDLLKNARQRRDLQERQPPKILKLEELWLKTWNPDFIKKARRND